MRKVAINIGDKYHYLTVLSLYGTKKKERNIFWNCLCACGKIITIRGNSLTKKRGQKSCGCHMGYTDRSTIKGIGSLRDKYSNNKGSARKRNLDFNLSFEEFVHLISLDCLYCDSKPKLFNSYVNKTTNEPYSSRKYMSKEKIEQNNAYVNGVDRVDNKIGYMSSNCIPCCSDCNFLKGKFTLFKWLSIIERFQPGFTKKIIKKLKKAGIKIPKE